LRRIDENSGENQGNFGAMSKGLVDSLKDIDFHKVVPFNAEKDKLVLLDFTKNNNDLTDSVLSDTKSFSEYLTEKLIVANARYGIGGYAEHRTIYKRSELFDKNEKSGFGSGQEEPRRFHLGVDVWGKIFTPVMAPLDGKVHSFAFNNRFGDYGATIILSHFLSNQIFHTLYGHLSLASIKNLREGETIYRGDVIGEFGTPQENGNWPPHLHFQIIKDLQGMKGDYPGVCKYSEREMYMDNCPDADLILRMMQFAS
jgi:peptidoglycan LD-endopeptidase LytH